jgi:phosphatidate cytidylyltransferase
VLTRIVTAVLAGSITLAAILWREPWALVVLLGIVLVVGLREAADLSDTSPWVPSVGLIWLLCLALPLQATGLWVWGLPWGLGCLTLFVRFTNKYRLGIGLGTWLVGGLVASLALAVERAAGDAALAPSLLLLALLPLWVGDSLAYFVGKAIGKHKLAPSISPNKTWEGAIANLVGCLGAAVAIGAWLRLPVSAGIAVGLSTGIIGQIGDLLQSRIKRLANVKDSGSILPGHGGVLDRLDSFLFSAYPSLLALWLLTPEAFHVKQWPW